MLTPPLLRDHREPRRWDRIWEQPPGFFLPNCTCCGGGAGQTYFVFGGSKFGTPTVRLSSTYNWTGGWATKTSLPTARDNMGASTPASPGSAYIYGGIDTGFLTDCQAYTPDAFTTKTSMSTASYYPAGTAIMGKSYAWGGYNSFGIAQNYNQQYDPSGNTWASKTALTAARSEGSASYIGSKGYFICGVDTAPTQKNNTYEYDPTGNTWTTKSNHPSNEDGQNSWTISGTIYTNLGFPGGKIQKTYIVDTWSAGTNPTAASSSVYACGASLDTASAVGWFTGGNLTGSSSSNQHLEFVPSSWTVKTNVTNNLQDAAAAMA